MEIEPGQPFTIWRKLEDPNDSTTYYVQATVYDMRDNSTIQTVNLTDQTGRIFSKQIDAPNDSSGQGRWIAISTRVYTDSGYTTLSEIKKEESREYKVIARRVSLGGGGSGLTVKDVRAVFVKELEKLPEPEKIDLTTLENLIKAVGDKVDSKEVPTLDLSPVLEAIRGLSDDPNNPSILQAIKAIPKPDPVNFEPVLTAIEDVASKISGVDESSKKLSEFIDQLKTFVSDFADQIEKSNSTAVTELSKKAEAISNLTFTVKPSLPEGGSKSKQEKDPNLSRATNLLG